MKRLIAVLLIAMAPLLLSSCGDKGKTGSGSGGGSGSLALLALTSPNGGETWNAQSNTNPTISWTQSGVGGSVRIELYKSGSLFLTLTVATENDGEYSLEIPPSVATSGEYTVKIVSLLDESITDESETSFTITNTEVDTTPGSITVTNPNGGESWEATEIKNISWNSTNAGSSVNVDLYRSGDYYLGIAEGTANDGAYSWLIPSSVATASNYKVKITSSGDASVTDQSNGNLSITSTGAQPTASLSCTPASASENGGNFTCTVSLSAATTIDVDVNYSYSGTATSGTDWNYAGHAFGSPIGGGSASISAGETSASWTFFGVGDNDTEGNETIIIDIDSITNPTVVNSSSGGPTDVIENGTQRETLTLTDDVATEPTVTMSCEQVRAGCRTYPLPVYCKHKIRCTFSLSHVTSEQVDLTLAFSGTATAGTEAECFAGEADYEFIGSGWETNPCDDTNPCDVPASASSTLIGLIRYNRETEWDDSQTVIIDIDSVTNGTEDGNQQATLTLKKDGEI